MLIFKSKTVLGVWSLVFEKRAGLGFHQRPESRDQKLNNEKGFTLLELMIVLFIIVILATIALPQYQRTIQHARETVLMDDLNQMRRMLHQYAADKGKMPQSLQDLVAAGYLHEIPIDPMTEKAEWDENCADCRGEDWNSTKGETGLKSVRSLSNDASLDGKPYNEF